MPHLASAQYQTGPTGVYHKTAFYPTALKGCLGIVFTHGVQMGRWSVGWAVGKVCLAVSHKPYGVGS